MKLVITRPVEDAGALAEKLQASGHEWVLAPLLDIVPRAGVIVPKLDYQAICVTSANAMRCLAVDPDRQLPVLAVGAQSAASARQRGYAKVEAHGGDVDGLAQFIASHLDAANGPLLYLSGAETSGDLEGQLRRQGFEVVRSVTYDALPRRLDEQQSLIANCDGVLLYSPRTAKLWRQEIERLNMTNVAKTLHHYCLSPQVAKVLPQIWHTVVAQRPEEKSLLALLDLAREAE